MQPAGHSHAGTYARGARTDTRANASGTQGRAALLGQAVGTRRGRRKWRGADESGRGCCLRRGTGGSLIGLRGGHPSTRSSSTMPVPGSLIGLRRGEAYGIEGGVVGAVLGDDGWRGGIYAWRAMRSGRERGQNICARGEFCSACGRQQTARGADKYAAENPNGLYGIFFTYTGEYPREACPL